MPMKPAVLLLTAVSLLACRPEPENEEEVGLTAATDPGMPAFPSTIGVLSLAIQTGADAFAGTDANAIEVCLTESDCFSLDIAEVDDFRTGEIDAYSFEGLNLPRSAVDRVEIRSSNGTDSWRPSCLEVHFDGEPVYCNNTLKEWFGDGEEELTSWIDEAGLHRLCDTCYEAPLTHGPMIGALTPESAKLWVRTNATRGVGLHLTEEDAIDATSTVVAWAYPTTETGFASTMQATGLEAGKRYAYGFTIDEQLYTDPDWHFQTPPPDDSPTTLSLAFGSCAKLQIQPVFETLTDVNPDLFLFVGDNHYANSDDLNTLRWYYNSSRAITARRDFLGHTATLATWDDHDFVGNNTDGSAPGKDTALRVFKEFWANPAYGTPETPGVFFQYRWGDVDIFMLDDRYYRGLDGDMLGDEQVSWLLESLRLSTATFKLLVSGSQWTLEGTSDSWRAFETARATIFQHIVDEEIPGVVLLSGDVHRSEFRLIGRAQDEGYDLPELTSSPLANTPSPCSDETAELHACVALPSFITLDIDTTEGTLAASMADQSGTVLHEWLIRATDLSP
jgi:alkaline phosphatase D